MKALKIAGWVLVGLVTVAAIGLALGIAVMLLWNWLMPPIFGLPQIGYWQAVGLFVLCHLLLGRGHATHARSREKKDKHRHPFADRVRNLVHDHDTDTTQAAAPENA